MIPRTTARRGAFAAALLVASLTAGSVEAAKARRFAVIVANDTGGSDTAPLRYAKSDAKKVSSVLQELGGYRRGDVLLLLDESPSDVRNALAAIEARIEKEKRETGAHATLLVYYSGHAKNGALRMGEARYSMKELRTSLDGSKADVRVGIIDSCQSGAITREKGGRPGPSFLFEVDDMGKSSGVVIITSSAYDEASQESDELGGSFFTHYLTSGLRGDADNSGDRRITLGEVYRYTYNKTVSETVGTRSGVQHPTYHYDLKGNTDLILTDLSLGRSGVVFDAALSGDYLLLDMGRETVAAEVKKEAGTARRLALPPGSYVIKKRLSDHLRMARFSLSEGGFWSVDESQMERLSFEDDYTKGTIGATFERKPKLRFGLRAVSVFQSFLSSETRDELFPPMFLFGLGLDLERIAGARLSVEFLMGGTSQNELELSAIRVPYNFFQAQGGLSMFWGFGGEHWELMGGPRVAGMYMRRTFPEDPVLVAYDQDHFSLSPGLGAAFRAMLGAQTNWTVEARANFGFVSFSVDDNRALFFTELGVNAGYRF